MSHVGFKYGNSIKSNNMTEKQVISYNIRNRKKIEYANSKTYTIYDILLQNNPTKTKNLLIQLGMTVFNSYVRKILNNPSLNDSQRATFSNTYDIVLSNLSNDEKRNLGISVPGDDVVDQVDEEALNTEMTSNFSYKYFVKTYSVGDQTFCVFTNFRANTLFTPGQRYVFDLQDESNAGTLLSFSEGQNTHLPVSGIYYTKKDGKVISAGTSGAFLVYDVPKNIDKYKLYVYNRLDSSLESYFFFPYVYPNILIEINYNAKSAAIASKTEKVEVVCLKKEMAMRSTELNGAKYIIEDVQLNYFDIEGFDINTRYKSNRRYGLYYGSYFIFINNDTNPFTILNKGKEHLIKITGDSDKKSTKYLSYLDDNNELDGDYDLYYGNIAIEVFGDFGSVSMYSDRYGINSMDNFLVFSDQCYGTSGANTNYESKGNSSIECMKPQTIYGTKIYTQEQNLITFIDSSGSGTSVQDISSILNNETMRFEVPYYITDSEFLSFYNYDDESILNNFLIDDYVRPDIVDLSIYTNDLCYNYTNLDASFNLNIVFSSGNKFVLNNNTNYDSNNRYYIYDGSYVFMNIPQDNPIALLSKNDISFNEYEVDNSNIIEIRVSGGNTTSNARGDYYDFKDVNDNIINIANGDFRFMRGKTYRFADYGVVEDDTIYNTVGHPFGIFLNGTQVGSYFSGGVSGENYIDITIPKTLDVDNDGDTIQLYYICENHNSMKVNFKFLYKKLLIGEESDSYDFFYGNIILTISGNVGQMSLYSYYNGYMGGSYLLMHKTEYDNIYDEYTEQLQIQENLEITTDLFVEFDNATNSYLFYKDSAKQESLGSQPTLYRGYTYSFTGISLESTKQFNVGSGWRENINEVEVEHPYTVFNILPNQSISHDINKKYGLYNGQYMIFDIPESNPIAFINRGKTDYFKYFGVGSNVQYRLGPDNYMYPFYYGTIIIYVYGDFGTISVYDFYNGYAGGKNLLIYTDICDYETNTIQAEDLIAQASTYVNEEEDDYVELSTYNNHDFESYMFFNIRSNKIILTDYERESDSFIHYDADGKFSLNVGTYVLLNVPETTPIAFLNKGIENKFEYNGYFPYSSKSVGPDGLLYTFYYGNINITVHSDFGKLSIYTLKTDDPGSFGGFLNGRNLLVFSDDSTIGSAVLQNAQQSAFPQLVQNFTVEKPQQFYVDVNITIEKLPYSGDIINFTMFGRDRNGEIDDTEKNPDLLFYLGDQVFFNFINQASNVPFGIYQGAILLDNPQTIQNNGNASYEQISWKPISSNYYYRALQQSDLVYGNIYIVNNGLIDIQLKIDVGNISPRYGSQDLNIELDKFELEFDEIVNVNPSGLFTLYKYPEMIPFKSFKGSSFTGSGTEKLTLNTNFNIFDRLEFSTTYVVTISTSMFTNIYKNGLSIPYYYDENGIALHNEEEEYLFKFTTQQKHDPKLLSIEYLDISDNVYKTLNSSAYINQDAQLTLDTSYVELDLSAQLRFTFNETIQYLSDVRNPYFTEYGRIANYGELNYSINDNVVELLYNKYSAIGIEYGNTYRLNLPTDAIKDVNYVDFDVVDSSLNLFFITIQQDPRPILQTIYPDFGQVAVPIDAEFSLTFNKVVYPGFSGRMLVRNYDIANSFVSTIFQEFDFNDPQDISAISGWGTNTITFSTPTPDARENYNYLSGYTLTIDNTCIRSEADNDVYYVGLDDETYYFRTVTSST